MSKIGVIGAGAFGTALASTLAQGGHLVSLWGRDKAEIHKMQTRRRNDKYLPDIDLPDRLQPTTDLDDLAESKTVLLVIPAQKLRLFLSEHDLTGFSCPLVLCAKGLETDTGMSQSEIMQNQGINAPLAVISGPGFAAEIASGKPTALSLACAESQIGGSLQTMLSTNSLRLYLSKDMRGVQLGGALKNVYAIACGIIVGADLGESARAALLTRGFAEMSRLAQALGAQAETLAGLSGIGDLALSCTSAQSRNFAFGMTLARSGDFRTTTTVEGIATATALVRLADHHGIEMPVAQVISAVLQNTLTITEALNTLMARPLKMES